MLKAESYILDYYSEVQKSQNILKLEAEEKPGKVTLTLKNGDGNLAKQNIVNNETTNKSDLKPEKIECPTCGFLCLSKKNFRDHKKKHLTVDCQLCGKTLSKLSNFRSHQLRCTKDFSNYRYPCTICDGKFERKCDLKQHHERCHTVRTQLYQVYQCNICDFHTLKKETLREHTRTHDLSCNICNQKVRGYKHLLKHRQLHEQNLQLHDLKKCPKCDKQFIENESLVRHKRTHEFRKCNMCDYKSNYKSNLNAHTWRIHMKPKIAESEPKTMPKCSFCDYTSKVPYNVHRHEETCSLSGPEIFCIV